MGLTNMEDVEMAVAEGNEAFLCLLINYEIGMLLLISY